MSNPLSWGYMTTPPGSGKVLDPFGIAFLIVFGVGFLVSLILSNDGARRFVQHPVARRVIRRLAGIALIVFGAGIFFFAIRALEINPFTFGLPLWLWLCVLAALAMALYFVYYARRVYPAQRQAYERNQVKQRYLRPAAAGVGALRPATSRAARPTRRRRK
jgi:threonine/homoserine/homoserine lactone efflux protein